jgi:hypothetical protein
MRHYPHFDLISTPLDESALKEFDLVLLVTDHSAYDYAWIASQARLIVETRNAFKGIKGDHIYPAGSRRQTREGLWQRGSGALAFGVIPGRHQISGAGVSPVQPQTEPGGNPGEPRSLTQGAFSQVPKIWTTNFSGLGAHYRGSIGVRELPGGAS